MLCVGENSFFIGQNIFHKRPQPFCLLLLCTFSGNVYDLVLFAGKMINIIEFTEI